VYIRQLARTPFTEANGKSSELTGEAADKDGCWLVRGPDGAVSGLRRRPSETCSPFLLPVTFAKMGFDKSLEKYVKVRCVCKV